MTSSLVLAALLGCAAVTVAALGGWILAALAARWVLPSRGLSAPTRAALLAQVRLLPLAAVVILVPTQIHAFVSYEATRPESAGPMLYSLAVAGLIVCLDAGWRGISSWRDTARIVHVWRLTGRAWSIDPWPRPAWTIRAPYPIVAVVGALRPQLFLADRVVEACTPRELTAIVAHEEAHVAARDNLVRLLFHITPGARLFARIADPLERAWVAAAEEAADMSASRTSSALELASALTKVARLAAPAAPGMIPASTLISDSDLPARVRRLLDDSAVPPRHPASWLPVAIAIAIGAVAQAPPLALSVHELFELLVRHG